MRRSTRIAAAILCAALQACATPPLPGPSGIADRTGGADIRSPVTILVSLDGFRPDYRERGVTPNLDALAATGVSAAMRPSFPSKTFPNHWTLVTGLVPDRHGIVANRIEDPADHARVFTMQSDAPDWWNAAEPIWVTAEHAGIRTATMFWPGSNVAWGGRVEPGAHGAVTGGTRPSDWQQFNQAVTADQRVAAAIDWLRRPPSSRPRFVTLYFDTVDTAGHRFGPGAAETTAAIAGIDHAIGRLVSELAALHQPANLVVVADHGMAATGNDRVVALDRLADPADYRVVETGPYATLEPVPGHADALERALLRPHDAVECWRKADLPARLRYGHDPRIPPYLCLANVGWTITEHPPTAPVDAGAHGYDNAAPEMAALFIASGPAIRAHGPLPGFDNVDVAPLLRDLLGLPPGHDLDGDDAPFRGVLVK